jgi:hypothetical protein
MVDNATIYIADPSLLGTKLFRDMDEINSCEGLSQGRICDRRAIQVGCRPGYRQFHA